MYVNHVSKRKACKRMNEKRRGDKLCFVKSIMYRPSNTLSALCWSGDTQVIATLEYCSCSTASGINWEGNMDRDEVRKDIGAVASS